MGHQVIRSRNDAHSEGKEHGVKYKAEKTLARTPKLLKACGFHVLDGAKHGFTLSCRALATIDHSANDH